MATSEFKQLADKLKQMEGQAKKFAGLFTLTERKLKSLKIKFAELVRENQRLKLQLAQTQRDLKQAQERAIWSNED